jgi:small subunit ribosomal protein S18
MPSYKNRQCWFTENSIDTIDYKNVPLLRRYMTQYNKIVPKYYSGNKLKYQKMLSRAIKRARYMALVPYTKQ